MFVNKFYVDEIYDAYLVRPTIRFANWLWHKIEIQGIDRVVNGTATASVFLAQRLWQTIDVRGIQGSVERLGSLVDDTSHALEVIEPRTLQHHLMVVVYGVGVAIGLLYWLVLGESVKPSWTKYQHEFISGRAPSQLDDRRSILRNCGPCSRI